jgi:hypothetical protein
VSEPENKLVTATGLEIVLLPGSHAVRIDGVEITEVDLRRVALHYRNSARGPIFGGRRLAPDLTLI